jgi:hypothetical protein
MERILNSQISIDDKIYKTKELLSKMVINEAMTIKFTSLKNNNKDKKN